MHWISDCHPKSANFIRLELVPKNENRIKPNVQIEVSVYCNNNNNINRDRLNLEHPTYMFVYVA